MDKVTETQEPRSLTVPIISLWQPWAQWVALGWKPIDTRLHKRFAGLVGKRIGIHYSQKWDLTAIDQARPYLTEEQIGETYGWRRYGGFVTCTALVKEFRELTAEDSKLALIDCGTVKRYGLILSDVRILEQPEPCKGRQGIFYVR